ncbi:MAG: hypothetical protein A3B68_05385 [Candidatus Melainabacteria bacterium RIFCSPHIGHO2_02_FULL_34_12]|nr:MAG: hypothetical protein A3B68_05385 [Candidatus Melainabacteria bacterium RIFCSPHIGHO2_02_FULL_34_12]
MIPAALPFKTTQLEPPVKLTEQKPLPYRNEWRDGNVSFWELVGYLPDNTAAGDKYNYFNHIQSRWTDGMWLKTSVLSNAQVHHRTGLLEISYPRDENEVRGFYLSVTLPDERAPVSQFYIDTTDREIAKNIHMEFISRYNMIVVDKSRLMRLGFEVLCNYKKEEAVNEALLWLKGQHSGLVRCDNKVRVSPNKGVALARNILSQMARTTWEAMGEAAQRRRGKI